MTHFLAFLALAVVLVAIPGPAVTLTMKNALVHGPRAALMTALGVLSADLMWAAASLVGVTAIIVASGPAFTVLKILGAAYLIYLGAQLLLGRRDPAPAAAAEPGPATRGGGRTAYRQGLVCDLSNPKTLVTFTTVIPQFLPAGNHPGDAGVLGVAFALVGFASLLVYGLAFARLRGVAGGSTRLRRTLLRGSGAVLIGFGATIAAEAD